MSQILKIGDSVNWSGGFGRDTPAPAVIKGIEYCTEKREKYGKPVEEIDYDLKDFCVFDLDNGHWAYGEQITKIP